MDALVLLIILKFLGLVHLSWLGVVGYGILIDFVLLVIYAALEE